MLRKPPSFVKSRFSLYQKLDSLATGSALHFVAPALVKRQGIDLTSPSERRRACKLFWHSRRSDDTQSWQLDMIRYRKTFLIEQKFRT